MANVKFMDLPTRTAAEDDYLLTGNTTNGLSKTKIKDALQIFKDEYKYSEWIPLQLSSDEVNIPSTLNIVYRYNQHSVQVRVTSGGNLMTLKSDGTDAVNNQFKLGTLKLPKQFDGWFIFLLNAGTTKLLTDFTYNSWCQVKGDGSLYLRLMNAWDSGSFQWDID